MYFCLYLSLLNRFKVLLSFLKSVLNKPIHQLLGSFIQFHSVDLLHWILLYLAVVFPNRLKIKMPANFKTTCYLQRNFISLEKAINNIIKSFLTF